MKTFNLKQAANFLNMTPEGLRRKACAGEVPGAKPGKHWCFLEDDLVEFVRSNYPTTAKTSWGVSHSDRRTLWHSTKEETPGGLSSATVEREYKKLLAQKTK